MQPRLLADIVIGEQTQGDRLAAGITGHGVPRTPLVRADQ
jgi:hypothetical protein